jgi:hypothetical protein
LERERVEREEALLRQQESNRRLATLKGTRAGGADAATAADNKHVNLFELEESTFVQTALTGEKEKTNKNQVVMPVRFGSVVKKQDQPFYVRPSEARNDDRCKARMDPMKAFVRPEHEKYMDPMKAFVRPEHEKNDRDAEDPDDTDRNSSRRRSHRRKHSSRNACSDSEDMSRRGRHDRKQKRRRSNTKDDSTDSIEELRKRRRERERTESQREAALRADSRNDSHRRYQDQFHPGLSRR